MDEGYMRIFKDVYANAVLITEPRGTNPLRPALPYIDKTNAEKQTGEKIEMNQIIKSNVREFKRLMSSSMTNIVKACEIYVESIDDNEAASKAFRAECPEIPEATWGQFEAIGRKQVHARLFLSPTLSLPAARRNKFCRLPYSIQDKIYQRGRFEYLTPEGDVLMIDLLEASTEQLDQMIDGATVRTLSAQKLYVEGNRRRTTEQAQITELRADPLPYIIQGGKVVFRRNTSLTRAELKRLLAEM